ncbi:hypothetical protein [Actinocrispum sp. NPDC049592]|uniref:hypothetical protein n=1 Tax=Actinocrispum sp. NPDC049592 TaxID=3154835 RepID=UPI003439E409
MIEDEFDEDVLAERFGPTPTADQLPEIRALLAAETARGMAANTLAMKLWCTYLFLNGSPADTLLVWQAKESGFDASISIDGQLLLGAGIDATVEYLTASGDEAAPAALAYIREFAASADSEDFTPEQQAQWYRGYYGWRA